MELDLRSSFPTLRSYQISGIEWLYELFEQNVNGILADEMGLGKTLQIIAFLLSLRNEYLLYGPHLIVAPLSVINSWITEIKKFSKTDFSIYVHYGTRDERAEQFQELKKVFRELQSSSRKKKKIIVFLFSYDMIIRDVDLITQFNHKVPFQYLIVDEAHRLKNSQSVLFAKLLKIKTHRKLLLTGTPLQNSIQELLSLLYFISIGSEMNFRDDLFVKLIEFENSILKKEKGTASMVELLNLSEAKIKRIQSLITDKDYLRKRPDEDEMIKQLHKALKPYLLRRTKAEVCLDLPPKIEKLVYCPQTPLQKEIHRCILKKLEYEDEQQKQNKSKNPFLPRELSRYPSTAYDFSMQYQQEDYSFQNLVMQLRKICNHSYLFLEDMKTIPDDLYEKFLLESSGKLFVLDKLLDSLLQQKSKILLFSQFTSMLTILEGYIQQKGIRYCRLDGSTDRDIREISIEQFQNTSPENNASVQIFLLSTRAGGVGLNLQQADTVILFDSDWNPQQDLQAISRVHRIGQTKPVLILRLLSAGPADDIISVDEYILQKAKRKLLTEKKVIADGQFNSLTTTPASNSSAYDSDGMFEMFGEEDNVDISSWFQDTTNEDDDEDGGNDFSIDKAVSTLFAKKSNPLSSPSKDYQQHQSREFMMEELQMNHQNILKLLQRNPEDPQIYSLSINWSSSAVSNEWKPWLKLLKPWRNDKKELLKESSSKKMQKEDKLEDLSRSRRTNIKRKYYGEQLDLSGDEVVVIPSEDNDDEDENDKLPGQKKRKEESRHQSDDYEEEEEDNEEDDDEDEFLPENSSRKKKRLSYDVARAMHTKRTKPKKLFEYSEDEDYVQEDDEEEPEDGPPDIESDGGGDDDNNEEEEEDVEMPDLVDDDVPDGDEVSSHTSEDERDEESVQKDICCICEKLWLTRNDLRSIQVLLAKDQYLSQSQMIPLMDTMIICDECEGSFHILCAGQCRIPETEWFCNFCSAIKHSKLSTPATLPLEQPEE